MHVYIPEGLLLKMVVAVRIVAEVLGWTQAICILRYTL